MSLSIYEFVVDPDSYAHLETDKPEDLDMFIGGFRAEPMAAGWRPPGVRIAAEAEAEDKPHADFAGLFGAVPVLSRRAVDLLSALWEAHGELLQLRSGGPPYWAFNVLTVCDIVDEDETEADWFEPGRMAVLQHLVVRHDEVLDLPPIFKLEQWRDGQALVTDPFLDLVAEYGLVGLTPKRVGEAPSGRSAA